jgi:HEAT repeat protein
MAAPTERHSSPLPKRTGDLVAAGGLALLVLCAGGCGDRGRTEELIAQMHSQETAVRLHAIRALGERGPKSARAAVPALSEALRDSDAFVRRDAARALGQIGPAARDAAAALRLAAKDRNPQVRKAAAEALQEIQPTSSAAAGKG